MSGRSLAPLPPSGLLNHLSTLLDVTEADGNPTINSGVVSILCGSRAVGFVGMMLDGMYVWVLLVRPARALQVDRQACRLYGGSFVARSVSLLMANVPAFQSYAVRSATTSDITRTTGCSSRALYVFACRVISSNWSQRLSRWPLS